MGTGSRVANLFGQLSWSLASPFRQARRRLLAAQNTPRKARLKSRKMRGRKSGSGTCATAGRLQGRGRRARGFAALRIVATTRGFTPVRFADNQAAFDVKTGEDPVVRQAAIEALGDMNGTVVAVDPNSGRILAMVNQPLALSEGAQPCSTIKLSVALAALSEGIVTKDTKVGLGGGYRLNMTEAIAHSNNAYFEALGRKLGFERVAYYSHQFGLGELAGYHIQGEHWERIRAKRLTRSWAASERCARSAKASR